MESGLVLRVAPFVAGVLLFFIQLNMNDFYWYHEINKRKRDVVKIGTKSFFVVMVQFYFYNLVLFGFWLSDNVKFNEAVVLNHPIKRMMFELGVSLLLVLSYVNVRIGVGRA